MTQRHDVPPKVTVAIPVYNSASTLERCINSATSQTMKSIEIIVVDDGSSDESGTVAEALALDDRRIKVLRLQRNHGEPHVMNVIAGIANGDWIAVLDAKDAFLPDRLERLVHEAESREVQMVVDNLLYVDFGIGRVIRTAFDPTNPPRTLAMSDFVQAANTYADFDFGLLKPMIRRSFIENTGIAYYEHTRLMQNFYYLLSFFAAGGRALILGAPLYKWTLPSSAGNRQRTGTTAQQGSADYLPLLRANEHFVTEMNSRGMTEVVTMLEARSRQYRAMIFYHDARLSALEGRWFKCAGKLLLHPVAYALLASRILARGRRALRGAFGKTARQPPARFL